MADLKKNTIHTVTVEGYASKGEGVSRVDGRVLFVKGVLAGETCRVKILKDAGKIVYAKLEELLEPSPSRIEPKCPNFGKCGGCDLWHMDYSEELRFKLKRAEDALRRIGGLEVPITGIVGARSPENYRNKAIYNVGKREGRTITGFYRERSHEIIPAEHCHIQAGMADRAAAAVRGLDGSVCRYSV